MRVKQFMRPRRTALASFATGFSLLLAAGRATAANNGSMGPVSSGSLSISVSLMPRFQVADNAQPAIVSIRQTAPTAETADALCIKSNVRSGRFSIKLVQPPGSSLTLVQGRPSAPSECVKMVEAQVGDMQPSPSPQPNARAFNQPVTLLISAE